MPQQRPPAPFAFAAGVLLLASLGVAAAWVLLAMAIDRQSSWMALVVAADAALVVRLLRMRPGALRAACGVLATLLAVVAANWVLVAAWLGRYMGLLPWESMLKLGPGFGWQLVHQANGVADLAWLAAGVAVAALACR